MPINQMKRRKPRRRTGTVGSHGTEAGEGTECLRDKGSEGQREGATDDTHDTHEVPPLATRVASLQEAVQLALKTGVAEHCMFNLARAIKAFETTVTRKLPENELPIAFELWWTSAKPLLPTDAYPDEYWFVFKDAYAKVRSPLGANPLEEAIRRADSAPAPAEAARYPSPNIKRLVAVCFHLQELAGDAPFFLAVRDAARICRFRKPEKASAFLAGLVGDGILSVVTKGKPGGTEATRFRYHRLSSASPESLNT